MAAQSGTDVHVRARWLAWGSWALSLAFTALGLWLLILNYDTPIDERWGVRGSLVINAVTFATVGAVVAARQPRNPIGWLFCWMGLASGIQQFADEYAIYTLLVAPGALPAGDTIAWVLNWLWVPSVGPIWTFLLLLFPDGRLPSPRWRPVAWLAGASIAGISFVFAFTPGPLTSSFTSFRNPFGLEGADAVVDFVGDVSLWMMLAAILASAASLVVRLRRSRGVERQQLKWFVYAAVVLAICAPAAASEELALQVLIIVVLQLIPIAVGVAILRYRLYDIDILINRTLVYGALTVSLALVYLGCVVVLQGIVGAFANQARSELITVVSTLAIAALFSPLRRRIQHFIDRRFYRRKYDATKVLQAFSARMRDETDLDVLTADLLGVVQETMQPEHVGLWLRDVPGDRAGR